MGTTEIIIVVAIVVVMFVLICLFSRNTDKITTEKRKQEEAAKKAEAEELKKSKAEKDALEKETKEVMEQVSNQAEEYIKSLMIKDDEAKKAEETKKLKEEQRKEVKPITLDELRKDINSAVPTDPAEEQAAIILGIKKKSVHILDDEEEDDGLFSVPKDTTASILSSLELGVNSTNNKGSGIELDDFQEDSSVGEEFRTMSKEMKVLMMANVLAKKEDQDK